MKTSAFAFCLIYHLMPVIMSSGRDDDVVEADWIGIGNKPKSKAKDQADSKRDKRYELEIAQGDMADLFSTNIHKHIPPNFSNFARRFIPLYPYSEKSSVQIDDEAEERLDTVIREALKNSAQNKEQTDNEIRPVKAPLHIVQAIARQAALLQEATPVKHPDEYLYKQGLRNEEQDYWNSAWVEVVSDSSPSLRSSNRLESVRVKIMPGSKLYKLISMTRDLSPKLLYVINDKEDDINNY